MKVKKLEIKIADDLEYSIYTDSYRMSYVSYGSKRQYQIQHNLWGQIVVKRPESRKDVYSILHELGHRDFNLKAGVVLIMPDLEEVLAWNYAFRCVKAKYHEELLDLALKCLKTYGINKKLAMPWLTNYVKNGWYWRWL